MKKKQVPIENEEETRKLVRAIDKLFIQRAFLRRAKEIESLRKHDRGEKTIHAPDTREPLRAELQKGIDSLDRGAGQELDIEQVIRTARAAYERN